MTEPVSITIWQAIGTCSIFILFFGFMFNSHSRLSTKVDNKADEKDLKLKLNKEVFDIKYNRINEIFDTGDERLKNIEIALVDLKSAVDSNNIIFATISKTLSTTFENMELKLKALVNEKIEHLSDKEKESPS